MKPFEPTPVFVPAPRRSRQSTVSWGDHHVTVGGNAPVRVQSMTNTDTADAVATAIQVKELAVAGSELVRITEQRRRRQGRALCARATRPHGHPRATHW